MTKHQCLLALEAVLYSLDGHLSSIDSLRFPLSEAAKLLDNYMENYYKDISFGVFLDQQKEAVELLAKSPEVFGVE